MKSLSDDTCEGSTEGHTSQDFHDSPYLVELDQYSLLTVAIDVHFR